MGPRKRRRSPMVGPCKRRCGSACHGRWDHDGTPCPITMRAVPSPPNGLAMAVQTGPHDAQDGDDEQDANGHIRADEDGGEDGGHDMEGGR